MAGSLYLRQVGDYSWMYSTTSCPTTGVKRSSRVCSDISVPRIPTISSAFLSLAVAHSKSRRKFRDLRDTACLQKPFRDIKDQLDSRGGDTRRMTTSSMNASLPEPHDNELRRDISRHFPITVSHYELTQISRIKRLRNSDLKERVSGFRM